MSTFLVLPPRELLEHELSNFLARVLPGVSAPDLLPAITDRLAGPDTFVVHREDLPDVAAVANGLAEVFGAEPGDRVIEFGPPRVASASTVREWTLTKGVKSGTR